LWFLSACINFHKDSVYTMSVSKTLECSAFYRSILLLEICTAYVGSCSVEYYGEWTQDSSAGIATGYGLDGRASIPGATRFCEK
jgi:hypothetical protein